MKKRRNKKATNTKDYKPHGNPRRASRSDKEDANIDAPLRDARAGGANDWRWYAQNEQLVRNYASYPFGVPLGSKVNFLSSGITINQSSTDLTAQALPGVMMLYFIPTMGVSTQENDPINIAMRNIYSFVRHQNSGHTNYDAPDLMMYLMAMDSIYMLHAFMKRAAGILPLASPVNRYAPKIMFEAMGLDYEDFVKHYEDFKGFINLFTTKIQTLCVPNNMSYMARHSWMCENMYCDSAADKAQTYIYSPLGVYQFALDSEGAGSLTYKKMMNYPNAGLKFSELVEYANSLVNPILANEDMNIMSGDILKAFGMGGVVTLAGIPDGYLVYPVYNQEVMSQIENATFVGFPVSAELTQNKEVGGGYLISNPTFSVTFGDAVADAITTASGTGFVDSSYIMPLTSSAILNMHHDNVEATEVMVATRLMVRASRESYVGVATLANHVYQIKNTFSLDACGSEVLCYGLVLTWDPNNNIVQTNTVQTCNYIMYADGPMLKDGASQIRRDVIMREALECFDWHPPIYTMLVGCSIGNANTSIGVVTKKWINGVQMDVDNYTFIDIENIRNMHAAALLSEFSLPSTPSGM